ncbi:MAG: WYL domain-containing protein [Myxococcales bacterium]|nr:WYL domain-containing protein [Myxococcales bacterium]
MSSALLRHWQMLRFIPRAPRKVDALTLQRRLDERGFVVSQRSIQRDLTKLSAQFPLVCDDRSKPYGWSWMQGAEPIDLPGMDVHAALAFSLASQRLQGLLPKATIDHMRPHFERATNVLDGMTDNQLSQWRARIRVLPTGLPMAPPQVDPALLEQLQEGLLHRRQLRLDYLPRGETEPRQYIANPAGLVYRGKVAYLVCALFDYPNVVQLAIHRVVSVAETGEAARELPDWDLDNYIDSGAFGFVVGEQPIKLVVRIRQTIADGLAETPLSADQELHPCEEGWVLLKATVADTAQLRVWLRGHGQMCRISEPESLRKEISADLAAAANLYDD